MHLIASPEVHWPFLSARPVLHVGGGREPRTVPLHPAPAYPHDVVLVEQLLRHLEQVFPLPRPPLVYLTRHDGEGGVNAVTYDGTPLDQDGTIGQPIIVLFGKPTPIHPAVTRYVLAHEYGHAVADYLGRKHAGREHLPPGRALMVAEYIELRGLVRQVAHYGPATWHADPEEIAANDFRVLVAGQEVGFWPHEVPHPHAEVVREGEEARPFGQELRRWWQAAAADARESFGLKPSSFTV